MTVLLIGGPLDGELREVGPTEYTSDRYTYSVATPKTFPGYHIANGIARHESVSEEEVARRVRDWRERWIDATDGE